MGSTQPVFIIDDDEKDGKIKVPPQEVKLKPVEKSKIAVTVKPKPEQGEDS